jgi:hypothetical protein
MLKSSTLEGQTVRVHDENSPAQLLCQLLSVQSSLDAWLLIAYNKLRGGKILLHPGHFIVAQQRRGNSLSAK